MIHGRYCEPTEHQVAPWVAIANEVFAQRYWPGVDPIGKQLLTDGELGKRPRHVVGW